jgi:hypothetical protein
MVGRPGGGPASVRTTPVEEALVVLDHRAQVGEPTVVVEAALLVA